MIDTLKFTAPLTKKLLNAIKHEINDTPAMNYSSIWKRVNTPFGGFKLTISFENKSMEMELSPVKHLMGHNLFGTNLPEPLILGILKLVYDRFDLEFTNKDQSYYERQDFKILRGDITGSFFVGSQGDVVNTMALIRDHLLTHGHDIVVHEGTNGIETIYVGKSSSHSTFKVYNKYVQIMATSSDALRGLPYFPELLQYSEGRVRFEYTSRSRALKRHGLRNSKAWTFSKARKILEGQLRKFGFLGQLLAKLPEDVVASLNDDKLRKYDMWSDAIDMLKYYSPKTVERDRKFFLKYKLDIARTREQTHDAVVLSSRLSAERLRMTFPKKFVELGAVFR